MDVATGRPFHSVISHGENIYEQFEICWTEKQQNFSRNKFLFYFFVAIKKNLLPLFPVYFVWEIL